MPLQNRNPIFNLKAKRVRQVVNDNGVLQILVLQNPEVFDEEAIFRLHAICAVQNADYIFGLWVYVVYDCTGVARGGGREHVDVPELGELLQELVAVGPNFESDLAFLSVLASGNHDMIRPFLKPAAVYQGLIEVQQQRAVLRVF